MKNIMRRFVTAALTASMLTLTANAYTVPDYDFDYSKYLPKSTDNCSLCNTFHYQEDSDEFPYSPSCIMMGVKCTYSIVNMEFSIEDFPEIQEYAYMIEKFDNIDFPNYTTEETISEYLDSIFSDYHHIVFMDIKEEYQTVENAKFLRDTIVAACDSGLHPELMSVEIDTLGYYEEEPGNGDVNNDGDIDALDATLAARFAVGTISLDSEAILRADVNGDYDINAIDATLIARYAVGYIDSFDQFVSD